MLPHGERFIRWFACASLVAGCFSAAAQPTCVGDQHSSKIYTVSVVPQKPLSEIFAIWSPLLDRIGKKIDMCFSLILQSNIQDFEGRVLTGEPDFSWMNPYHAVMVHKKLEYMPLVRDGKNLLSGILVVRKDSLAKSIEMLKDDRIAFPSPNSFAASLLIRAMLDKNDVAFKPVYVKTHSNVYRATMIDDVSAGGGVNNTFSSEPVSLRNELRVLYETPGYAAHPIMVNPRVPKADQLAFTEAFIALADHPGSEALLEKIPMPKPIIANYARDYQPLEALGLEKYVVTGSD